MTTLLADIGGTNARFALLSRSGKLLLRHSLACDAYPGPSAAAEAFLGEAAGLPRPELGAFAVATPFVGADQIRMTNRDWSFSLRETAQGLGLARLRVLNDFEAVAMSLPYLTEEEAPYLRRGEAVGHASMAVLGPGTGLGVAGLAACGDSGWHPLPGEGGHRDLAALDEREWAVIQQLIGRFGRASAERALSGPGLVHTYQALRAVEGMPPEELTPAEVSARASADPLAQEALRFFAAQLGAVAGDLALTLGARGGIFLAGGILPRLGGDFPTEIFLQRFLAKGRFSSYVEPIPVRLITHDCPALVGLAHSLD